MRKLLVLAIVAMASVSLSGCSRPWTGWLSRGAQCDTCNGAPVIDSYDMAPGVVAPEQLPLPGRG
jgi:hypothetical protein